MDEKTAQKNTGKMEKSGESGNQPTNTGGHGASADTFSGTLSGQPSNTRETREQKDVTDKG